MAEKKLSHYDLVRLWKKGFDAKRGYFVGKPNDTALACAQEMELKNIENISITGAVVGNDKKGHQIVIVYWPLYAVDITNEIR
jgi:hypothetical protein